MDVTAYAITRSVAEPFDDTVERVTFALCDAGSTPNSKIGAAIRKQAPVLVANLLAAMKGETLRLPTAGTPRAHSPLRATACCS